MEMVTMFRCRSNLAVLAEDSWVGLNRSDRHPHNRDMWQTIVISEEQRRPVASVAEW
ncbi:hypothetical protein A2U01_0044989 [Trifolium medium]|uniref:Uncharacterized protein n=1 Tax=Trifolium medium TaxID=97028 RepID=A0A392QIS2_9FABA|nr:hypothetical protein [Trifolium medium]